ncbi:catabolite repression protein CreC, partial [Lecanoromycetidae sp. Uapishka_2]
MSNVLTHPSGPEYQLSVGEGTYFLQDNLHLATPPPHPQETPSNTPNPLATTPAPPKAGIKLSICITAPRKLLSNFHRGSAYIGTRPVLETYSIKEHDKESKSSSDDSSDGANIPYPSHAATERTPVFGENNVLLTPLTDRAYQWLDLSSPSPARAQPLMKILFAKAHVLCHDINPFTKGPNNIDVLMGASTGDIVWFEAYSQKYVRINKGNVISNSAISEIRWLPGSENLFLASHMDGTLLVYDKERDDAAFTPESQSNGTAPTSQGGIENELTPLHINKSVNSKNQKANPVASWKISNHRITAFAFSPDSRHLAVVSEDGSLRMINYLKEQLTDLYPSYYGAFTCVCFSPDGKYILTGSQDDLVSIWSLTERRIVARCSGHHSWVTAVAFDPWRCDARNYRFGSVGEDRRLLLWDFNVGMLRKPKAASIRNRASVSSYAQVGRNRTESSTNPLGRLRSTSSFTVDDMDEDELIEHPVESRTVTAELPPVMSKVIDEHPLSWVGFEEECIITACGEGHVRVWRRPSEGGFSS